ncbi:MAG: transcription repressor NadR [Dethiosulfovibrio peptidovorans]|nr:MAG: transcription repressor NadR [Dethiosulfovibrio peptidovorans]
MVDRRKRLKFLIEILRKGYDPVSGADLADRFAVSRQAIVQDIAILREEGVPIVSTSRGYRLDQGIAAVRRVMAVCHQADDLYRELSLVVSMGARMVDVFIDHPIYGELRGNIDVGTQEEVRRFLTLMETTGRHPLLSLSGGFHLHTMEAPDEEILQAVEDGLREAGFLVQF